MSDPVCSICQCECADATPGCVETLECGHAFHASCLVRWLRQGALTCPMCRGDLSTVPNGSLCLEERGRYLRQYSRRKSAPAELKRMVRSLQDAEAELKEAKRQLKDLHHKHRKVFQAQSLHVRKVSRQYIQVRRAKRLLSVFEADGLRLPHVSSRRPLELSQEGSEGPSWEDFLA